MKEEDNDEVMVPVYENGTVVSGYEHLIEPKVIVINREQLQKLNNSKPVNVGHPPGGLGMFLFRKEFLSVALSVLVYSFSKDTM